ncbi:2-desacetyl-2-hydroxyethyl bacteriochlorophyllide A dehydrogenase [Trueperella bonasi]|uniref:2-desacetyl-2-hydroxyethyl bacteriochlorophyllide A dehydrogenase n=1 Tax=Trueperella bonasi TaxID=312286 RepID=A0ABT9NIG7_9ACTO|nr:alcohol dehydrogenase catalytic domain-containing protein [Trueperella bonasi]MDP9806613.1 2-desacetyl-2-hydroxyethyl bacteriochlorophyllide A dehydrogenase [Trueperella bonasi]
MLAAQLNAPEDLKLVEKDRPTAGPGEVLLKIEANTMCGTDYRLYTGAKTAGVRGGVVPGHEIAGRVEEIGEGAEQIVPGLEVGQQATVSIVVSCGYCRNCLNDREHLCVNLELFGYAIDGGLQEYMVVPERALRRGNLITTSEELDPKALCLAEPISCCLNGLDQFKVEAGDTVAVLGAGPIGLIHAQLALASGAKHVFVSNRSEERRKVADRLGAIGVGPDELAERVAAVTDGAGADVVIVCIGAPDLAQEALELAAEGGRVNYFAGFPKGSTSEMEPNLIHYKELKVTGGSNARRRDVVRAIKLLEKGVINVGEIVTHTFPLSKVKDAYAAVNDRLGVKICVVPDSLYQG